MPSWFGKNLNTGKEGEEKGNRMLTKEKTLRMGGGRSRSEEKKE